MALCRNFALTHSFKECGIDDFLLGLRKKLNQLPKQCRQIIILELAGRGGDFTVQGIINIALQAFGCASVSGDANGRVHAAVPK